MDGAEVQETRGEGRSLTDLAASASAAAVTATLAFLQLPVIWKLTEQTLCMTDFDGFREVASARPGGALDWFARLLQQTGSGPWAVVLGAAFAGVTVLLWRRTFPRHRSGALSLLSLPAALLPVCPALFAGTALWMLDDCAAGFRNALGLWFALGALALVRRRGALVGGAVATALSPVLGLYPLLGAMAGSWKCLPLAAVPWALGTWLFGDLAPHIAYLGASGILDRFVLTSLNAFTALPFLLLFAASALDRLPVRAHAALATFGPRRGMAPLAVVLAFAGLGTLACAFRPRPDLRGQLRRERAVVEGRYADVLAVPPANDGCALRMESAYRVLALQRTDQLPARLFDEPFWSSQEATDAQEDLMDGHELLYAYGLLLPARRYIHEQVAIRRWMPRHYLYLGDIALICGERALAERNYRQLARCCRFGELARERLRFLHSGERDLPGELGEIADLATAVRRMLEERKVSFFDTGHNAEQLVYNHFFCVRACDERLAKFCLSAMLLKKASQALSQNRRLIQGLFSSEAAVPECLQQALLVSGRCPAEAISPRVRIRAMNFDSDARRVRNGLLDRDEFLERWASSFFFYNAFVK